MSLRRSKPISRCDCLPIFSRLRRTDISGLRRRHFVLVHTYAQHSDPNRCNIHAWFCILTASTVHCLTPLHLTYVWMMVMTWFRFLPFFIPKANHSRIPFLLRLMVCFFTCTPLPWCKPFPTSFSTLASYLFRIPFFAITYLDGCTSQRTEHYVPCIAWNMSSSACP